MRSAVQNFWSLAGARRFGWSIAQLAHFAFDLLTVTRCRPNTVLTHTLRTHVTGSFFVRKILQQRTYNTASTTTHVQQWQRSSGQVVKRSSGQASGQVVKQAVK
jgi:hypothetical protein